MRVPSVAALFGVVLCACQSDSDRIPNAPAVSGSRGFDSVLTLEVDGEGSTADGSLTSDVPGIRCAIRVAAGRATRTGTCLQAYGANALVTIIARPSDGAVLRAWTGCSAATDEPLTCQVSMEQARRVGAVFGAPAATWPLRIVAGAAGSGRVVSTPAGVNCTITKGTTAGPTCAGAAPAGARITLTATATAGNYLKAWAGAGCDTTGTGAGTAVGTCVIRMTQQRNLVVGFDSSASNARLGQWDAPMPWPAVGIHAHLLPDGRVMTWGREDYPPVIWNPADGSFVTTARPVDLFCAGHAYLPDGRLLVTGGHGGQNDKGIASAQIFDYRTDAWTAAPDMRVGRWYPTTTTLPSGEMLTMAGRDSLKQLNLLPEVYQRNGTWRVLTGAPLALPYYPFVFVAPDGRVVVAGPEQQTRFLDPSGLGRWTNGPASHVFFRDYGSAVMYDAGKILMVGGGPPTSSAEVIDLNAGAAASWRVVAPMAIARRQMTATLLANGFILVTGGTNAGGFNGTPTTNAVLAAEAWDPATETWTTLARMTHFRVYHSAALLLPDARVLSLGSGQPAATGLGNDYTAEIYNPPYLYRPNGTPAPRPVITSAPTHVAYGQSFTIGTAKASSVAKVTWIRLGSMTHSFNQNQRMNYLAFTVTTPTTLAVKAPSRAALSPPGHYLLFLISPAGVPSVAAIVAIS